MNSFILIDGITAWAVIIIFAFVLFGFCFLADLNFRKNKTIEKLETEKENLKNRIALLNEKYYKATYKTPEVK